MWLRACLALLLASVSANRIPVSGAANCSGPTPLCEDDCGFRGYVIDPETNCITCECNEPEMVCRGSIPLCENDCGERGYYVNPATNCPTCDCSYIFQPTLSCRGPIPVCENDCGFRGYLVDPFTNCPTCNCGTNTEKPGKCPDLSQLPSAVLCESEDNQCDDDSECLDNEKCCEDHCGRKCKTPEETDTNQEKPGECPDLSQLPFAVLCDSEDNQCDDDSECPDNEKCCEDHCGRKCKTPEKTGSPPTSRTTSTTTASPTTPTSTTKSNAEKPGECPDLSQLPFAVLCESEDNQCGGDSECPDNDKCCQDHCGRKCKTPKKTENTLCPTPLCANDCGPHDYRKDPKSLCQTCHCDCPKLTCECEYGYKLDPFGCPTCDCLESHRCPALLCLQPCLRGFVIDQNGCVTCTCQGDREGECPAEVPADCGYECNSDNSCPGDHKCCENTCGSHCLAPISETELEKPGECPDISQLPFAVLCESEDNRCDDDSECSDDEKCCEDHCGRKCKAPVRVVATCPSHFRLSAFWTARCPLSNQCDSNDDCSGNMLCCGCPRRCVSPTND